MSYRKMLDDPGVLGSSPALGFLLSRESASLSLSLSLSHPLPLPLPTSPFKKKSENTIFLFYLSEPYFSDL